MPTTKKPTRIAPRKLLVAALGVATVNYVVACGKNVTSGNLPAPQPVTDAATTMPVVGNLPAPVPPDAGPPPKPSSAPPTVGNLPAPVPQDAAVPKPTKK